MAAVALLAAVGAVTVQCAPAPSAPAAASTARPTVHPVSAADLGATWRPGCPAAPTALRRIEIDYLGFDGGTHRGQLVVNEDVVDDVIAIVNDLTRLRYPIEKMRTVEHYPGAEDELSMRDNNTSAFNCRPLPGTDAWSQHAYGRAIDINPLVNPYTNATGDLQPKNAARYLDRRRNDLGLLHGGDAAVRAFTSRGWRWGGDWHNPIDYQHFETG
ncbi:MAG: M15 family metallopeptidase [Mycolicibacterium sp.]|nr:M15 family metallopeptidase [Mycolicibacterium sp.]